MTLIEAIVETIKENTHLPVVVKGGTRNNPIEYFYSRTGIHSYRLEIYINDKDLLKVQSLTDDIINLINDFGDINTAFNGSIDVNSGGTFTKDNIITQSIFMDVVDYGGRQEPVYRPEGVLKITVNGVYDVAKYAKVDVQTSGGGLPTYDGPTNVEPRRVQQVLPTENKAVYSDITVKKIHEAITSNTKGLTFSIGKE